MTTTKTYVARTAVAVLVLFLLAMFVGCRGEAGPTGPQGIPGPSGQGLPGPVGPQGPGATILRIPQPFGRLDEGGYGRQVLPRQAGATVFQPPALHCWITAPNGTGTAPASDDWVPVTNSFAHPLGPFCWVQWEGETSREDARWVAYMSFGAVPFWLYVFVVVF